MTTLRTATKEDFKVGTTLITSEGYEFTLIRKYEDEIWESDRKCHFEREAKYYKVRVNG